MAVYPRYSQRLDWHPTTNAISELLALKRRQGAPVVDLTESNPTRAGFDYPQQILASLSHIDALTYQPIAEGLPNARQAVSEYYAERGAVVSAEQILLTASTSEAYSYLFKLLADPGDRILIPRPSYPLLEYLARLESVELAPYPLRYDGTWHIDFEALTAAITPVTRAIVVVNPNNPTGSSISVQEWDRLQQIAADHQLAVVSDEVFSDYRFLSSNQETIEMIAPSPLAANTKVATFSLNGLSKVTGLPQIKLGWIVVGGSGHTDSLASLSLIADTFLSVSTPVQLALQDLLQHGAGVQQQIRERIQGNRAQLASRIEGTSSSLLHASGGWSAVLRVPNTQTDEQWALQILEEHNVLVQPGFFFDFENEAHLVVSLLPRPVDFSQGIEHLLAFTSR